MEICNNSFTASYQICVLQIAFTNSLEPEQAKRIWIRPVCLSVGVNRSYIIGITPQNAADIKKNIQHYQARKAITIRI